MAGTRLATAYVEVVPSLKGVGKAISDAFNSGDSSKGASTAGKSAGGFFASGLLSSGSIIGAASAVTSKAMNVIAGSIGNAVSRADMMNNFPKIMSNMGYSSEQAAVSIKKISNSLDGLPTTSSSIAGMVQQLAPLTSSLDEATNISLALNNALLAGGKSTMEQENALTQYTQMLAVGKVDMQAWRSLVSAMPMQLNQLSESLLGAGHNSNDLYEAMKNGDVSFTDFNNALVKLNSEGINGLAGFEQQARSSTQGIGTAMENVQNRTAKAVQKIIEAIGVENISGAINKFSSSFSPIADVAANAVTGVKNWLSQLWKALETNGALDSFKQAFEGLFGGLKSIAGVAVDWAKMLPPGSAAEVIKKVADAFKLIAGNKELVGTLAAATAGMKAFSAAAKTAKNVQTGFSAAAKIVTTALSAYRSGLSLTTALQAGLSTGSGTAAAAMRGFIAALNANPIMFIVTAIAALVAGLVFFFTQTETGKKAWKALCDGMSAAWNATVGAIKTAWNAVTSWFTGIGNGISSAWTSFTGTMQSAWDTCVNAIQTAWQTVANFFQPVIDAIQSAWQGFLDFLQPLFDAAKELFNAYVTAVSSLWSSIWGFIQPIIQTIGDGISGMWNSVVTTVTTVWNTITTALQVAWAAISAAVQAVWQPIATFFTIIWAGVQAAMSAAWNTISSVLLTVWNTISSVAMSLWNGIVSFLTGLWSGIVSNAQAIWNGLVSSITAILTGLWNGIVIIFTTIRNVLVGIMNAMTAALQGNWTAAWNAIKGVFTTIWDGLVNSIRNGVNTIGTVFGNIKNTITHVFAGAGNWLTGIGRNIIDGLVNGIKNAAGAVGRAVSNIANGIPDAVKKVLGIHSPSRVMRDMVGVFIPQGLAAGIAKGAPSALNAMTQLGKDVSKTGTFTATADYTSQFTAGKNTAVLDYVPNTHSEERAEQLISLLSYYLPIIVRGQETNLTQRDLKRLSNGLGIL